MINLIIGTAQFGQKYGICNQEGAIEGRGAEDIVNCALSHGIGAFDTARLYGDSELVLGQALSSNAVAKDAEVITKYYADEDRPEELLRDFEVSQKLLNDAEIYGVLIHNADILLHEKGKAIWSVLGNLKNTGVVKKIGVSVYQPQDLEQLVQQYDLDLIQLPCNLLDQRFLDKSVQDLKREYNLEFHARSLFLQGLLLSGFKELPEQFAKKEVFENLSKCVEDHQASHLDLCLSYAQWVQENEMIDRWVIGVDSVLHLEQIIKSMDGLKPMEKTVFESLATNDLEIIDPRTWKNKV